MIAMQQQLQFLQGVIVFQCVTIASLVWMVWLNRRARNDHR